jgi:DNA-binding NarL/FixJ family response regulator
MREAMEVPQKQEIEKLGRVSSGGILRARLTSCGLTQRQQEVTELLMRGLSNREIAEQLLIEEYTVKVHLRDIFQRMNVHRRTALVAKILQLDLTH